jgi:glutathione S-transferase
MSLKIHAFPPSPRGFKVLLTAHHLGLDYAFRLVDLTKGDQNTPEFAALNPNKRMPVIEDDGLILWESNAILQYLATKEPLAGLLPQEAHAQATVVKWLFWDSAHWDQACAILIFENVVKRMFGGGEPSASEVERGAQLFRRCAEVLNGELAKHRYVAGDTLTVADFAIGSATLYADQARFPLEDYRAVRRWAADIKSLPAWSKTAEMLPAPPP